MIVFLSNITFPFKKHFLSFLFIFLFSFFTFSQTKIDSLQYLLKKTSVDTIKVKILHQLYTQYRDTSSQKAKEVLLKAIQFSEMTQNGRLQFKSYNTYGDFLYNQSNFETALVTYKKGMEVANKINYTEGQSASLLDIGDCYSKMGDFIKALEYQNKNLKFSIKNEDDFSIAGAYNSLGIIYTDMGEYSKAMEYYTLASIKNKEIEHINEYATTLANIGLIHGKLENFESAKLYFKQSDSIFKQLNDQSGRAFVLKSLGVIYKNTGEFEKAFEANKQALASYDLIGNKAQMVEIYFSLGSLQSLRKTPSEAFFYYQKALKIAKEIETPYSIAYGYQIIGKTYMAINDFSNAKKALLQAIKITSFNNYRLIEMDAYQSLATLYSKEGDFKKAFESKTQYALLRDSLYTIEKRDFANDIEAKYQNKEKVNEIEQLKSKNELVEQQKKNQRYLLLGGLSFTSLIGLFFYFQYKNRKKINTKLKELDTAKSNFFVNVSHEFRTPLTLILGPIDRFLKKKDLNTKDRSNLEMMQRNSNRLLSLVDELLDISKIEEGRYKLKVSQNPMIPFVQTLANGFVYKAQQKKIEFTITTKPNSHETWFDAIAVEKIIVNLLSNAIKYTNENGKIECHALIENNKLHFEVKNTGVGLSKEEIKNIFERFYQVNENKTGVGVGLALVKELITLHKGSISVESTVNQWTSFKIILPTHKSVYIQKEIIKDTTVNTKQNSTPFLLNKELSEVEDVENTNQDSQILLIVDDNEDIRTYVSSIFKKDYTIITAENGEEGIDMAIKHIPDIIISDVMMPVLDGIQLSKNLKRDERTSHIPIILLTAKSGEQNEITGIKTGADDYITKPFSEDVLQLKVKNRIKSIKKLQERFSQEIILRPAAISVNSIEEKFLERVQLVLDTQITETSFSIQDFCEATAMSRMQLHRKLKALTGLTTSEFVKSERLKLAAKLLKSSDINISQIGYVVGFNDHAYFSKSFKDIYKCTPSEYVNKTR